MKVMPLIVAVFLASANAPALASSRTNENETTITRICNSPDPVLIIDTFNPDFKDQTGIDLDGDGLYDVVHGEFISRLIELNGQKVIREEAGVRIRRGVVAYPQKMADILNSYADKIEKGELKLSWVNFSREYSATFANLNGFLGYKKSVITRLNIDEYRDKILKAILAGKTKARRFGFVNLYEAVERMNKLDIPIIVSAGNNGYRMFNVYSLFPKVITVGGLNRSRKKAFYSGDNSLITVWRKGSIPIYATQEGVDFNGDNQTDFFQETRRVPSEVLSSFEGKHIDEVVKEVPNQVAQNHDNNRADFHELTAKLPKGLYDTQSILRQSLGTDHRKKLEILALGQYFYLDGIDPRPLFFMMSEFSGELRAKQGLEDERGQYRNEIYGTSFANPNICNGKKTPDEFSL